LANSPQKLLPLALLLLPLAVDPLPCNLIDSFIMFRTAALVLSSATAFAPTARFASRTARAMSMSCKEGDAVPVVTFKCRVRDEKIGGDNPFDWKDVTTEDLFKGKRAVVFALPGGKLPPAMQKIFMHLAPNLCSSPPYFLFPVACSFHPYLLLHAPPRLRGCLR
jgi:hypothetical protein